MAVRFFRVFKEIPFRAGSEEFSNVYMYDGFEPGGNGSDTPGSIFAADALIVDAERSIHGQRIRFDRIESGLVVPPTGSQKYPVPGLVDYVRTFEAGTVGEVQEPGAPPAEWTLMAQNRISKRGWLRKYYHIGYGSISPSSGNTDPWLFSDVFQAAVEAMIQSITFLGPAGGGAATHGLCNSRGTRCEEDDWQVPRRAVFHELKY